MDAAGYSKRMANVYQSTGYHNPEAQNKSHKRIFTTAGNVLLQFKPQYEQKLWRGENSFHLRKPAGTRINVNSLTGCPQ
jgi:hypothetical protein